MNKKLAAKVQQLNPSLPQYGTSFAKCIVIEPETRELLLKKGSVYAVYEISSDSNFDIALIERVLHDVIYNSYYQSENISPIQSMEKAIADARDKVSQLSNDALSSDPQSVKFKITSAVLWGNVLYVVQYDKAESYLMREGAIKPISTMTEGTFSAASGIVKEEDVVILCTADFAKVMPPQKLLSVRVTEQDLLPTHACLLIKLFVDTSFTSSEITDTTFQKEMGKTKVNGVQDAGGKILKTAAIKVGGVLKKAFDKTSKRVRIVKVPTIPAQALYNKVNKNTLKNKGLIILPIIALALVGSIVITKLTNKKPVVKTQNTTAQQTTTTDDKQQQNEATLLPTTTDKQFKVTRIAPQVLYDIKITDPQTQPTEITNTSSLIIVTDKTSGKIYTSPKDAIKFDLLTGTFPGIRSITTDKGNLHFLDASGYKIINSATGEVTEKYPLTNPTVSNTYSDFLYVVSGDTLIRYSHKNGTLQSVTWGENTTFANARSIAIAYSIYVITSDGTLEKYTSGNKVTFAIKGLDDSLAGATKVIANSDLKNVYVLDSANKRIVILDSDGSVVKQYKAESSDTFSDLKSFDVSQDEKTLYLLDGSKVLTIDL